ncbi:MAG: sulfate reduction electron transfer complex DsrMKJOP subunit DsrM [Bacteroidetes bacterium]|nr:sulfate reduction electron transfer complex DsrMKJOP subunit DsrM [Bacteroidota bacterium]
MGIWFSLVALAALTLLGLIGANVPGLNYVFAVIIPYIAITVFIVGIIVRIVIWARSPVPFRIPTTGGQQKSLSFIKQNRLDNPSSYLGVLGRMALEVLFFRSLFRNTKAELKEGPNLTYGANKWLWLFSLAFHWSFLIIFLRHFRFFTQPIPFFVPYLQEIDGFFQIWVPIIYITDCVIVAALSYLFFRRVFDSKIRYISLPSDYFPLLLISGIAITGILMRYFFKTDLVAVKELMLGILSFSPSVHAVGLSSWFYLHLFFVCSLLIYFPMSKLVHLTGIFMSPTRNLANTNRMVRHVNPWIDELKMKPHTYEEYEDEFRTVMKGAGMPLDKEESHVS